MQFQERAHRAKLSVTVNEAFNQPCLLPDLTPWVVTPTVFALSCLQKDNRATQTGSTRINSENYFCGLVSGGRKSQIWWIRHSILHQCLHECECVCLRTCVCVCECSVCKVGQAISCWVGDMKAVRFFMPLISLHKCTKLSPPYHGRKTPTTTNKNPGLSSWLHFLKFPKEGKVGSMKKEKEKSLLSPTNTSWRPGQS